MHIEAQFRRIPEEDRNKKTFHAAIAVFMSGRNVHQRGYVEFLNTALKYLKKYDVHKDLDTYKALLNVFPKGPLIPTNQMQKIFMHYPLQQNCCVRILDEMEWNNVIPDKEVFDIVVNIFGSWTFATRKVRRQLYWMPKLKYSNKYLDRRLVENKNLDDIELARIALKMMSRDPGTTFSYAKALPKPENDLEATEEAQKAQEMLHSQWIVSAQSPLQRKLIERLPEGSCLYVDGPKFVWVMSHKVKYVVLSADAWPGIKDEFVEKKDVFDFSDVAKTLHTDDLNDDPNVHQQKEMTILGLAVLENNNQNVAAAWVNHLTAKNPRMSELRVLIRIVEDNFVKKLYEDELRAADEDNE
uniref:Evolutionarily conserved signaling intermediate in Toll pathway, mitochondrial n=1 Tax=Acrobeloides nanus TaxID=290746 RepID=A0A914C7X3_9BILA